MALLDDVSLLKSFKSVIFKVAVDTVDDTSCLQTTEEPPRVGVEGPDNFSFSPT